MFLNDASLIPDIKSSEFFTLCTNKHIPLYDKKNVPKRDCLEGTRPIPLGKRRGQSTAFPKADKRHASRYWQTTVIAAEFVDFMCCSQEMNKAKR